MLLLVAFSKRYDVELICPSTLYLSLEQIVA